MKSPVSGLSHFVLSAFMLPLLVLALGTPGCASAPAAPARKAQRYPAHEDVYASYAELAAHHQEGRDYEIITTERPSNTLIMAFHGGNIEEGTTELSETISGQDLSLYSFVGKLDDSRSLHITATHFDEPRLLAMMKKANECVAIHGSAGEAADFCVGGGDQAKREALVAGLKRDFPEWKTCDACCVGITGVSEHNVVNRCSSDGDFHPGVQVEMSPAVRTKILGDSTFRKKLAELIRHFIGK